MTGAGRGAPGRPSSLAFILVSRATMLFANVYKMTQITFKFNHTIVDAILLVLWCIFYILSHYSVIL